MGLTDFKDEKGFIGHKNDKGEWDFGDSAQRTFTSEICKEEDILLKIALIHHVDSHDKSQFVRHWDQSMWWGKLWNMSRDNFKPIMWAAALKKDDFTMRVVSERNFFLWNFKDIWPEPEEEPNWPPDFILPTIVWGAQIRARRASRFGDLIILSLCDIVDLLSTCILVIKSWFKPNETSSDLNQMNEIIFKCKTVGTPFSWLVRKIYAKFRANPIHASSTYLNNKIKGVLRVYYWDPKCHPPMWEVLDPMIDKYIS